VILILQSLIGEVVCKVDRQLVLKTISPEVILGKVRQCTLESALEELFCHVKRLQLMHGLNLLFALGFCGLERLVLVLYSLDFTFDLLLPAIFQVDLSLVVVGLEFSDFLELGLLLNL
jgi:hypothetical protein